MSAKEGQVIHVRVAKPVLNAIDHMSVAEDISRADAFERVAILGLQAWMDDTEGVCDEISRAAIERMVEALP